MACNLTLLHHIQVEIWCTLLYAVLQVNVLMLMIIPKSVKKIYDTKNLTWLSTRVSHAT